MGTLSVAGSVATDQARVAVYHTIGPEHMELWFSECYGIYKVLESKTSNKNLTFR